MIMPRGLLLEYMGTLLIVAAWLFTNSNPIVVGLATTAALFIADGHSNGFFTPLGILTQYMLGRVASKEALKLLAVQCAAAASGVLLYKGRKLTSY
jgi:hypothetical protein